jgi:hypothetical protein
MGRNDYTQLERQNHFDTSRAMANAGIDDPASSESVL